MSGSSSPSSSSSPNSWHSVSSSVDETVALGCVIGAHLVAGDIVALIGELGAGKTQFVRGLSQGLGCGSKVSSPTFVIAHEHESHHGGPVLVHIDAYRLRGPDDLESIGWDSLGGSGQSTLSEMRRNAVIAVEWADKLGQLLGDEALCVRLAHHERGRAIDVSPSSAEQSRGSWLERWPAMHKALDGHIQNQHAAAAATRAAKRCAMCGEPVQNGSAFEPFCSSRCRMADLGRWLSGDYKTTRAMDESDLDET